MLRQELDYRREAESLRRFGALAAGCEAVVVPEVIDELSTDRILTMTWLEGEPFEAVRTWPERGPAAGGRRLAAAVPDERFRLALPARRPAPGQLPLPARRQRHPRGRARFRLCRAAGGGPRAGPSSGSSEGAWSSSVDQVLADYLALGFNPDLLEPMAHLLPALNQARVRAVRHGGAFLARGLATRASGSKASSGRSAGTSASPDPPT